MNYHTITKDDMLNGEGLRVILWVSGCDHHCINCQNPETHDPQSGVLFDEEAKNYLFECLSKEWIKGITFSGGDPLFPENRKIVKNLMKEIKEKFMDKDIWLYTGYKYEQVKEEIEDVDVLVDGPFIEELKDKRLHWKGSSNQRVIDVQQSLKKNKVILKVFN